VNNRGSSLLVFWFGNPHWLESSKRRNNWPSYPYGILSFWRSNNFDFHITGSKCNDFFLKSFRKSIIQGGSSRKYDIWIKVLFDINIAFVDRIVSEFMQTLEFLPDHNWSEEYFRTSELLVSYIDNVAIWEFIMLIVLRWLGKGFHFFFKI